MSLSDDDLHDFLAQLAALGGQGSKAEWIAGLGAGIGRVLERSPNAGALVDAWIEANRFRPTPSELNELEDRLREDRTRAGDGPAWAKGCADCVGGWRTVLTLRRDNGRLVNRETNVACDCPRGERIATGGPAASVDRRPILNWRQAHHKLSRERGVPRDSGLDGLIGWQISDAKRLSWRRELLVNPPRSEASAGARTMLAGIVGGAPW